MLKISAKLSEEIEPVMMNHSDTHHISNSHDLTHHPDIQENHINSHDAVVHVEESVTTYSRTESSGQQSRRVHKIVDEVPSVGFDHDENKYKRKSFLDWFQRWLNSTSSGSRRYRAGSLPSRYCKLAMGFMLAVSLIVLFIKVGRLTSADDPALDPMSNPNIRVVNE